MVNVLFFFNLLALDKCYQSKITALHLKWGIPSWDITYYCSWVLFFFLSWRNTNSKISLKQTQCTFVHLTAPNLEKPPPRTPKCSPSHWRSTPSMPWWRRHSSRWGPSSRRWPSSWAWPPSRWVRSWSRSMAPSWSSIRRRARTCPGSWLGTWPRSWSGLLLFLFGVFLWRRFFRL